MRRWSVQEDENTWCLFLELDADSLMPTHPLQILKAPKRGTPYAEYWPDKKETALILEALNSYEALRRRAANE